MEISAAVMEERLLFQEARQRFNQFCRDLQVRSQMLSSDEEGFRRAHRDFRAALETVSVCCREFCDTNDNRAAIGAAVLKAKAAMSDVRAVDRRLSWIVNVYMLASDSFIAVLQQPLLKPKDVEEEPLNTKRLNVLNEIDELVTRLHAVGDPENGGLEQRESILRQAKALRRDVASDMCGALDAVAVVTAVHQIHAGAQSLRDHPSDVTGVAGHIGAVLPSIDSQVQKIVKLLDCDLAVPVRTLIPATTKKAKRESKDFAWAE